MISKIKQLTYKFMTRWSEYSPKKRRSIWLSVFIVLLVSWMVLRKIGGGVQLEHADIKFLSTYTEDVKCITRPKALAETYLSVQFGGRLDGVLRSAGDPVKVGDIIAVVDRTANSAGLKSALSGFRLAQSDYGRVSSLFSSGSVTREELDSSRSKLDVKRAELEQAKQRVEDSVVRSTIDGIVSVVVFKVGDKVPDGGRIAAVEDPRGTLALCRMPSDIAANFDQPVAPKIKTEVPSAELTSATTPATEPATKQDERPSNWKLLEESAQALPLIPVRVTVEKAAGGFQGLEVDVRLETSQPEAKVTVGQLTEITLQLPERKNVAEVPSLAVVRRAGGAFVLVEEKWGKYRWNQISIVKQTPKETVASGIPEGAKIFVLKDDLSKIETYVQKHLAN